MFLAGVAVLLVLFLQCPGSADADADADVDTDTEPEAPLSVNTATAELRSNIANPGRGWYRVEVTRNSFPSVNTLRGYRTNENVTVVMVETDIGAFRNSALNNAKLAEIRTALTRIRGAGLSAIFRAVYSLDNADYSNFNPNNPFEPDMIQILMHIEQLKSIFHEYEDILLSVQAGFIGPWGEWHTTRFGRGKDYPPDIEHQRTVGNALLNSVPASINVGFRRPEYIRNIADPVAKGNVKGDHHPVTREQAFGTSKIARSSFFNDSLMSEELDMDTYKDRGRAAELAWINSHTRYVPMVGETNKVSSYNDSDAAITLLNQINMQSLNSEYLEDVYEKWRKSTYDGMNAHAYISMKLGYRFVLKNVQISEYAPQGGTMRLDLRLVNDGFGHLLQRKKFEIVLKRGSEVHRAAIDEDARMWDKNVPITRSYRFRLPAAIATGDWDVYLGLSSPFEGLANVPAYAVQFSNENVWDSALGLNKIGSLKVTDGTSGGGGTFVQITP